MSDDQHTGPLETPPPNQATGAGPPAPSAAPGATSWKIGDTVLGGYRIDGELGRGGMGTVHLLSNPLTGARYAVKRSLFADERRRRQFLVELLTWSDLPDHPHLLPLRICRTEGDEVF